MSPSKELSDEELILKNSFQKIAKLKIIANFFNNSDLINIVLRTKIIHNLFESNKNLDIHKLDLFHLQFTNSLLDLVQKIKKSIEQQLHLIRDEMNINTQYIERMDISGDSHSFKMDANLHSKNISKCIEALYKAFAEQAEFNINWNVFSNFSNTNAPEFFREISESQYLEITDFSDRKVYENIESKIEKKLLSMLFTQSFRIKFLCGLKFNKEEIDVFKFLNSDEKFVFLHALNSFYLLNNKQLEGLDISKNVSQKNQLINQLEQKNSALVLKSNDLKANVQPEVKAVLKVYLDKISSVSFLEDLENVDEQTNILKAMLAVKIQ